MDKHRTIVWNYVLLLIRIWLGYRLISASYSSVIDIISSPSEREFFRKWFGDELHFPMPVVMAFLAKGTELAGGILILIGLFTRISASLVAFTMFVATITANLGSNWIIDGGFTVSYMIFSIILIVQGAGNFSIDNLIKPNSRRAFKVVRTSS
jgi:putative oxidoreductase